MNTLGKNVVFTSFGESHGRAIGGVLDGVPAGVRIDLDMIREALDKRAGRAYPHPLPEGKGEDKRIVGRHDACIAVRAVAVVEAMAALVLQDIFSL